MVSFGWLFATWVSVYILLFPNKPIYKKTASYGHFGREPDQDGGFGWEKLDLVDALSNEFK